MLLDYRHGNDRQALCANEGDAEDPERGIVGP